MAVVYDDQETKDLNGQSGISTPKESQTENPSQPETNNNTSLYNSSADSNGPNFRQKLKGNASKLIKNKAALGLFAVGGGGVIILLIFLLLIASSLKIPNFYQNVISYQFARVTRTMSKNTERISAQKMGVDTADSKLYAKFQARYGNLRDSTWGKFDKYRPNKVIGQFHSEGTLNFNYGPADVFGRKQLKGVTIDNKSVLVNNDSRLASRLIPGVQFGKDVSFARDFAPALDEALRANNIGPIIRGRVADQIRKQLGISLVAWEIAKYQGLKDADAKALLQKETYARTTANDPVTNPKASVKEINQTAESIKSTETALLNDPIKIKEVVNHPNQLPPEVVAALEKSSVSTLSNAVHTAVGIANPIYAVAVPVCLIYDGSLSKSGSTINTQNDQLQRQFYFIATSANQQMNGYTATGSVIGAINWKLGDIEKSNPELRASGQKVNTSNYASVQASPIGQFSLADALFPDAIAAPLNAMATQCPKVTNVWLGAAIGAANIALLFFSGSTASVPEAALDAAAAKAVPSLMERILSKYAASKAFTKTFIKDTAVQLSAITAGTIVAKLIVLSQVGTAHSSLSTGSSFANDVDNGGFLSAGRIMQQQFYGRPMTGSESLASNISDQQFTIAQTKQQSIFERYAALNNAGSLVNRLSILVSTHVNIGFLSSLLNGATKLFNPISILNNFSSMLGTRVALAASDVSNTNYGNVEWGWSNEENSIIDGDSSYGMLENQSILDASGKQDEIASTYGVCFDGSKQIGDMLADGLIQRDSKGNVLSDNSLCSPVSLGVNNPKYGDLVFRWRVAQSYNNTLDQLTQVQGAAQ